MNMKSLFSLVLVAFCSITVLSQNTVTADEILQKVKNGSSVTYQNVTIEGVLDFTFMEEALKKLPSGKSWWKKNKTNTVEKQISSTIRFKNCIFQDDVLAYIPHEPSSYTFVANFRNPVEFSNCSFKGKAMFKYSDFDSEANFSNSQFLSDTTFKYSDFESDVNFNNTIFEESSTFKYSNFQEFANFKGAIFKETATFKYAEFHNGVSFNSTDFKEDLNFKYTKISGDFDDANMKVGFGMNTKYARINGDKFNQSKDY